MEPLVVGTTFSGIGTPEQALKNLNINHVVRWACDIDRYAKQTYMANHTCDEWYDDILTIDPSQLADIDLYVFGFPCQSYSTQGLQKGLDDERGQLLYKSLEILRVKQPKYFIAENVRGLLSHNKGETFQTVISLLESCNYVVYHKLLNSRDFGVPQNRPRVYMVGIRKDINQTMDFDFGKYDDITLVDILEPNPDPKYLMSPSNIEYCTTQTKFVSNKVVIDPVYARCLLTGGRIFYRLNGVYRFLTPLEMLRLQGFPDDFNLTVSSNQSKRQLGNSMTVPVVQAIIKNLIV